MSKIKIFNPCKKCIVKAACKQPCINYHLYIGTILKQTHFIPLYILAMGVTIISAILTRLTSDGWPFFPAIGLLIIITVLAIIIFIMTVKEIKELHGQ